MAHNHRHHPDGQAQRRRGVAPCGSVSAARAGGGRARVGDARDDACDRMDGEPTALIPAIRQAMRDVGPYLPLGEIQTMQHVTATAPAQPRLTTILLGLLAALALVLALTAYSTASVLVSERARRLEFWSRSVRSERPS